MPRKGSRVWTSRTSVEKTSKTSKCDCDTKHLKDKIESSEKVISTLRSHVSFFCILVFCMCNGDYCNCF